MRIRMLGGFSVELEDATVGPDEWRLRRAWHLVAMLAMTTGQHMTRDHVVEALWPGQNPSKADHNLHQAMYVARRVLRQSSARGLLVVEGDLVLLSRDGLLEVDVVEFERLAAAALAADDPDLLADADLLYRGDLLPEVPYADWALARREALRAAHHAVLVRLAQSEARSGHSEAAHLMLDRVLAEDATHEAAARASMRLLADVGRRSAALERYEMLREGLLQTYGTDPDDQSRELYRQILTAHGSVGRVRTAFVPSHRPTWPSPRGCGRRACW